VWVLPHRAQIFLTLAAHVFLRQGTDKFLFLDMAWWLQKGNRLYALLVVQYVLSVCDKHGSSPKHVIS
jgi:hypothetical protein